MPKKKDIINKKFGRLLVIEDTGKRSKCKKIIYKCLCDCGKTVEKEGGNILCGDTMSCGCLRKDVLSTHGSVGTRLYRIWANMLSRCRGETNTAYKHYGGRGIEVCKEWTDFSAFKSWSLDNGYNDKLTIDRKDVNGNYEPSNCRWATRKEQDRNKRNSINVCIDGEIINLQDLADKYGFEYSVLRRRILKGATGKEIIAPRHPRVKLKKGE